jgi:hypothetical protein
MQEEKPIVYVSLTTIPSRFRSIHNTIDSLLNQTYLPTKIYIQLSKQYTLRFNGETIPESEITKLKDYYKGNELININILEEDYGPGSKLLGMLHIEELTPQGYIIIVDDDRVYNKTIINTLVKNMLKNKKNVYCYDSYIKKNKTIIRGCAGVIIPIFLLNKLEEYYKKIKHDKQIIYHDDHYISHYFHLLGVNIERTNEYNETYMEQHCKVDELRNLTGKYSRTFLNNVVLNRLDKINIIL